MLIFYRIDEWNAAGNLSNTIFERSATDAIRHVSGMIEISAKQTVGIKHTSIQSFIAKSCDMAGWDSANHSNSQPTNFAIADN